MDEPKNTFIPKWNTANPYTYSILKDKRKEMRDNMTEAESVLWEHIRSKKLGVKFRRQHIIGNFQEVEVGFTGEQARNEVERCLRCDVRC